MIDKRALYTDKLKRNIDKWNEEINNFEARAGQAKADVQAEYLKQVEGFKTMHRELDLKSVELRKSGKAAWAELKTGVDLARRALGESIEAAKAKFN